MENYRRFVQNNGKIAMPLNNLLKIGNFSWTVEAQKASEELKQVNDFYSMASTT